MFKLIATDVDGTLVKDGTLDINPEYYEVIQKLQAKGILFVICSGRGYVSLEKLFAPIKKDLLFVGDGGAVVKAEKEFLKVSSLDKEIWKAMHKEIKANPLLDCFISTPDKSYAENPDGQMYKWLDESYGFPMHPVSDMQTLDFDDIIKFTVYHPDHCKEICEEHFIPKWNDYSYISAAGKEWVDCIAKETSKGTAIKFIQGKYGIKPEETLVFGDNFNDISMFAAAGTSYAVSNTHPDVISAATNTCKPYWEYGVLEILKTLV